MQEMLRPIPVALSSCTRFFEATSAMRDSFATLQSLKAGHPSSEATPSNGPQGAPLDSDCMTPPAQRTESSFDDLSVKSLRRQEIEQQDPKDMNSKHGEVDSASNRRLSWPPVKRVGV